MTANTPAGWYQTETDPQGTERYWDGSTWTAQQRQAGTPFSMGDQSSHPGGFSAHGVESNLAGVGSRIGARLLDCLVWIILGIPAIAISLVAFLDETADAQLDGVRLPLRVSLIQLMIALIQMAIVIGYEAIMNMKFNNTLGKKVTNTKIVKLDGSAPSLSDHITRFVPYILLGLAANALGFLPQTAGVVLVTQIGINLVYFLVGVAGIIMVATSDNEQALWDKIPGTTVVRDVSQ